MLGLLENHPHLKLAVANIKSSLVQSYISSLIDYHDAVARGDTFCQKLSKELMRQSSKGMNSNEDYNAKELAKVVRLYAERDADVRRQMATPRADGIYQCETDPPGARPGDMWYNCRTKKLRRETGNGPVDVVDGEGTASTALAHVHVHADNQGLLHKCYHKCRSLFSWQFFAGITLSFPIEHALWTKVPGFYHLAELLGLAIGHH